MSVTTARWGDSRAAIISARQACYYTNISPQHHKLNIFWWEALEEWERNMATKCKRVTGFSGPVFSNEDDPFRGEVQFEHGLVAYDSFRVPRAYWKMVVAAGSQGKLAVAAYLMDQVSMVNQEVRWKSGRLEIDLADYRITLPDLEKAARLRFAPALIEAQEL